MDQCLDRLEPGDTLVCTKLDRIGRSVRNLMDVSSLLRDRGVDLVCWTSRSTPRPAGQAVFTILAASPSSSATLSGAPRDGLAATTPRGQNGGREHG